MNGCEDMAQCQKHFEEIHRKLDRLDVRTPRPPPSRGNGKPGMQLRLDRLEAAERGRSRVLWLIAGSAVTLAVTALWHRLIGG
ncbi:MAG TPA: hypothetical protein VM098_07160 [Phycisphaerae bacterium]|nr:hypothetical protein [Phycisphaerae bacterium]